MFKKAVSLTGLALLVLPLALGAQSTEGSYTSVTLATDSMAMPDGSVQLINHFKQAVLADDQDFPLNNVMADCVAKIMMSGEGTPTSASGSCFTTAVDGHGYSMWWEMTEAGTEECPNMCGIWSTYGGYGRFAGLEAGGTWNQHTLFPEGSLGSWKGSIK